MGPELPAALAGAADALLEGASRRDLADRSAKVSNTYRSGGTSAAAVTGQADAAAYVVSRLPATYAAVAAVLGEAAEMAPDFAPRRLLDAGAGPGGASWAALEAWPELEQASLVDSNPVFLETARRLAADGPQVLARADLLRGDLTAPKDGWPKADLVIASYALAEIAPGRLAAAVEGLWAACEGLLAIIEPGTPAGSARVLAVRDQLIAAGGRVVAPCPHEGTCPMSPPNWCHFAQRLPRRRDHRLAKGADAPFEDEKYAYVVMARPGVALAAKAPRVLAPPRATKPGLEFDLCAEDGLERRFVPKRDRQIFSAYRRLRWGDRLGAS